MRCAFCSLEFDERLARRSCSGCFKLGDCSMVKCPRCGYEVPPEPGWIKSIKRLLKKEKIK